MKYSVPSSPAALPAYRSRSCPVPSERGRGPRRGPAPREKRRRTPGPAPPSAPLGRSGTSLRASLQSRRKELPVLRPHTAGRREAGNERPASSALFCQAAGRRDLSQAPPIARGVTRLAAAATILNTAPQPPPPAAPAALSHTHCQGGCGGAPSAGRRMLAFLFITCAANGLAKLGCLQPRPLSVCAAAILESGEGAAGLP